MSINVGLKSKERPDQIALNLQPGSIAYAVDGGSVHKIIITGPCEEDGYRNSGYEAINEHAEKMREIHTCNLDFLTPSYRQAMKELRRQCKVLLERKLKDLETIKEHVAWYEAVIKTPTRLEFD